MEQAVVKLIKSCLDNTVKADYSTTEADDERVINHILIDAEIALRPWAWQELVKHIGTLHRPF